MDYKGYELFMDIGDTELRARNRAVVLWNIFETNSVRGRATAKGVADMIGYTKSIPSNERAVVLQSFSEMIAEPSTTKVH